ncbi:outer membrane protein assembly factor BamC [uncultured Pseudoteredinibacter sp.]|uniref:outer membrane protein assembly factor BamC n=1 Tax=uncultured Pseudoteredinibacter sp. TaxID=1641701 RepID=UPI0026285693|nr:outer membrane protein assembly factor BamC [uncultured Pseudoteredinibacter sp.]
MYTRPFKPLLLAAAVVAVNGCSYLTGDDGMFRDRGNDYQDAVEIAAMKMPEQVDKASTQELYVIPPVSRANAQADEEITALDFAVPRPLPLGASAFGEHVKIQKLADRRWILAGLPPSEIWPKVRHFLGSNGLRVVYTDAINGIIETGWLQFKESTETKDRYRIQMEQGVQPDSTEIHVLHLSVPSEVKGDGQVNWPKRSINAEREAWLVDELAGNLAAQGDSGGATSLLAQTIGGGAKIAIKDVDREPVLSMALGLTRAWATLGHAVTQQGMVRYDENANTGVYYINFGTVNTAEEEQGFFSRMFSFGDDEEEVEIPVSEEVAEKSPYTLNEILSNLPLQDPDVANLFPKLEGSDEARKLEDVPGYLLIIAGEDGDLQVHIRDAYGQRLARKDADDLLKHIRRNLI